MEKTFCPYCGDLLANGCNCEAEAERQRVEWLDEYNSRPDVCAGWAQQDLIDLYRREM